MPKNKQKGKSKKAQKGPQKKGGGKKPQMGKRGGQTARAPSAVSSYERQAVSFFAHSEGMGIRGLIAVAQVGQPAVAGTNSGMMIGATASVAANAIRLSPSQPTSMSNAPAYASNGFISPALDLLSSAFTRYKCTKCKFIYRGQSSTASTQQLVFAFAADPNHPIITPVTAALPTIVGLESLSDSVPFAPWDDWNLDVSSSLDKTAWLYTSTDSATGVDDRLESFGSIGLVCASASTVTAVGFGVLYMDFEMMFKEFCPISATRPAVLRSLRDKLEYHIQRGEGGSLELKCSRCGATPSIGAFVGGSALAKAEVECCSSGEDVLPSLDSLSICENAGTLLTTDHREEFRHPNRKIEVSDFFRKVKEYRLAGVPMPEVIRHLSRKYVLPGSVLDLIHRSGLSKQLATVECIKSEPSSPEDLSDRSIKGGDAK